MFMETRKLMLELASEVLRSKYGRTFTTSNEMTSDSTVTVGMQQELSRDLQLQYIFKHD